MSYSLQRVGTKPEVIELVESMVRPDHPDTAEALVKLIESLSGDRVSLIASGHSNGALWSASSWPP